jgi:hypothetical protein
MSAWAFTSIVKWAGVLSTQTSTCPASGTAQYAASFSTSGNCAA